MSTKTICMLSDMHPLFDDRIYWKEALSLKKAGYKVIHIGFSDKIQDFISEEGIRLISVKKRVFSNNIFIHKLIKTVLLDNPHKHLFKSAEKVKADAYHIHDIKVNKIGNKLKNLPWKPKVIYDVHEDFGDMVRYFQNATGLKKVLRFILASFIDRTERKRTRNYDYFIHVTREIQQKFRRYHAHIDSIIIYNYSNLIIYNDIAPQKKVYDLVYCGLISKNRGVLELLKAISILQQKRKNIKALFLGGFDCLEIREAFFHILKIHNLEGIVEYVPSVPQEEVPSYLRKSKIGLCTLHAIKKYEQSIPIKVFEYMSFGLPIIGSNFGYIKTYISDSNSGITVNPSDVEAIAKAAELLLLDNNLYKSYSLNGIQAAKHKFNWKNEESKLVSVYNKIMK